MEVVPCAATVECGMVYPNITVFRLGNASDFGIGHRERVMT